MIDASFSIVMQRKMLPMGGFACGHGFLLFSSRESAVLRFMAAKGVLFSEICKKNTCRFEKFREVNILTTAKVANEMPQK